jgi:ATP-binding cassette subfamily B protein
MAVKMAGAFLTILFLEPRFALVVIPGGLVIVLVGYFIRPVMKRLHKKIQESDGEVRLLLQERLDNLLIVNAYGQQERSAQMADERMGSHLRARMKRNRVSNLNQICFGIAMQGMYLLAAGYSAWGILSGTVSYGTMTALLQMIGYLQSPLSGLGGYFTQWYAMLSSAERLMEAEALAPDHADIQSGGDDFDAISLENLVYSYVERSGEAELSVSIRYEDHIFRRGEFIALAGQSGCGKSTLLKVLMCVYKPDSGRIMLTHKDGVRPLNAGDRGLFAYVPQGNMLMSGTIRQIIAFYDRQAMEREAELWAALETACAAEFVEALPQGLDTVLGEHGAGLSEGQIQRIALARAIFSRRPILLLDEATSALDERTEARVLDNLKRLRDKTVLIVTHRPRACEICDRVIYMENREEGREE